jgi:hypothetical protein
MKINLIRQEDITIYLWRSVEIETDDYDELKNKPLEEVQQLIEDDEVELDPGADFNVDFVLEEGEMFKDKVCVENKFTFFEEVKD